MASAIRFRIWPLFRNLLLLSATLGLAALNLQILRTPVDVSPIAPGGGAALVDAHTGEITTPPHRSPPPVYRETLARPIFRADRKPFVAAVEPPPPVIEEVVEAPQAAPPAQPPEGLKLVGVMRDGEGRDRALVKSAQSPSASWLEVGDEIDGWQISEITQSGMTLSADAASVTLNLYPALDGKTNAVTP